MILTVMSTLARERMNSPMRVLLSLVAFGFGVFGVLFSGTLDGLTHSQMGLFGFIAAAGMIGQEVSSGVLTLVFARPIRRDAWVLGRWLGATAIGTVLIALQVLVCALVAASRHHAPGLGEIAIRLLEGVIASAGASAVLLMLSSLVSGLGDIGLLVAGSMSATGLNIAGNHYALPWLTRAGSELQTFLEARLDPAPLFGQGILSWFVVASYLSTVAICLVVAIHAVNRKELSYASG